MASSALSAIDPNFPFPRLLFICFLFFLVRRCNDNLKLAGDRRPLEATNEMGGGRCFNFPFPLFLIATFASGVEDRPSGPIDIGSVLPFPSVYFISSLNYDQFPPIFQVCSCTSRIRPKTGIGVAARRAIFSGQQTFYMRIIQGASQSEAKRPALNSQVIKS